MFKNLFDRSVFPRSFWLLMGATLIDQIGRFALIPFFGLYITSHFGISMTRLGELYFIWAIFGILGSFLSGAIIDKVGRKVMIVSGLVFSAGTSLFLGFADDIAIVFALAAFVGLLSDIGGPAQQAMVADMLPPERHADGFGIWRVVVNVAAVIGPLLAGVIVGATQQYLLLFVLDAALSLVTALVVLFFITETKPKATAAKKSESFASVLAGYGRVIVDLPFMAFVFISILSVITYSQMNTTMPVYMRDVGGILPSGYSTLLAINAFMVVTLQLWVTRSVQRFAPMLLLAVGVFLYAIGFGMFGFTNALALLVIAMVIITFGELIAAPVAQTVAARFAPADMRGRYLAMFGFSWSLPIAIGPYMAGWVWDNVAPPWIWYGALVLGVIGALGFIALHAAVGRRLGTLATAVPLKPKIDNKLFTELEQTVLEELVSIEDDVTRELNEQLRAVLGVKRDVSSVGFFLNFEMPEDWTGVHLKTIAVSRFNLDHVSARVGQDRVPMMFILWVENGLVSTLEGYTSDKEMPPLVEPFRIHNSALSDDQIRKKWKTRKPKQG